MRELEQRAYSYLGRNPIRCMDMIEALRMGNGSVYSVREDGVLIYERNSRAYFLAAENGESCNALCYGLKKPQRLVVHSPENAKAIRDRYEYAHTMECFAAAYLDPEAPPVLGGFQVRPLEVREEKATLEQFGQELGEEELETGLAAERVLGAFLEGQLAGVVGLYPEGSIGLLAGKEEYREQGVQRALLAGITKWCLENCLAPFAHVPAQEESMMADLTKLGFSFSDKPIYWLAD